jgi:hypothetical protein
MSTYDAVDQHLDALRVKAREALADEASTRAAGETDPVARLVHEQTANRMRLMRGGDDKTEREVEDRVGEWLQDATRNADADVRDMARRAIARLAEQTTKAAEPHPSDLLGRHNLTSFEVDRLRQYVAELPDRLAQNAATKAATGKYPAGFSADSLAAVYCRANGIAIGRQGRISVDSHKASAVSLRQRDINYYAEITKDATADPATRASARRVLELITKGGRR